MTPSSLVSAEWSGGDTTPIGEGAALLLSDSTSECDFPFFVSFLFSWRIFDLIICDDWGKKKITGWDGFAINVWLLRRQNFSRIRTGEPARRLLAQLVIQCIRQLNNLARSLYRGEVWRHVTMVAKILDLKNFSWQRRPFALSNDGRKVWAIVLSLSAMHRKFIRVNFFVFFFSHSLLRSTEILIPWLRDASLSPPY